MTRGRYAISIRGRSEVLGERTWVMGVLNVTPDSFSDGDAALTPEAAVAHGCALFDAGADVVDVGGESTRPGASPLDADEEIRRVVPVIAALREQRSGLISIDTRRAAVARAAIDAGADIVNDVSGLSHDPELAALVADRGVPAILMHLRGSFATMHAQPGYADVMGEIVAELRSRVDDAVARGVRREQILVDPGIGFSKSAAHSLATMRRLGELGAIGCPVLVGPSRKSFIGAVLDLPASERSWGTAAAVTAAILGGAHIVRVHDVASMLQVARVADAILTAEG